MSHRCQYQKFNGTQCKRQVPDSSKFCWQHYREEHHLPNKNRRQRGGTPASPPTTSEPRSDRDVGSTTTSRAVPRSYNYQSPVLPQPTYSYGQPPPPSYNYGQPPPYNYGQPPPPSYSYGQPPTQAPWGCPPCVCPSRSSTTSSIGRGLLGVAQAAPSIARSAAQIAQIAQSMKGSRPLK